MIPGSQPPHETDSPRRVGTRFSPQLLREVLTLVLLAVAIVGPRIVALDRFVTADEPNWARRSANFWRALNQGEHAHTYQSEHPGVTIMWADAAGRLWRFPEYGTLGTSQASIGEYVRTLDDRGREDMELLAAGRFFLVFALPVVPLLAFIFARRSVCP